METGPTEQRSTVLTESREAVGRQGSGGGVDAAEGVRGMRKQSSGLFSPRRPEHACDGRGWRSGFGFSRENRFGPITAIRVQPGRGAGLTEGGRNTERGFAGGRTGV